MVRITYAPLLPTRSTPGAQSSENRRALPMCDHPQARRRRSLSICANSARRIPDLLGGPAINVAGGGVMR